MLAAPVTVGVLALALVRPSTPASAPDSWRTVKASGLARQEISYVNLGGKLYLTGGKKTAHQVYNPATNTWSKVADFPARLDHIQGVALGGKIYYIGGLAGWPKPHVNTVYVFDPKTNTFSQGAPMPRGRGAGGVAAHNGKIYYAGGLHDGAAVAWFDVYDPVANRWSQLPDMPRRRDHFQAAVVDGKFYAIGGRDTEINATTTHNDAYDFGRAAWTPGLARLPTARGGFAAAALGREILVIGGEGGGKTYSDVEAYDTVTGTWRRLASMPTARHGIQAAVCGDEVYIAAGGTIQGGGGATDVHEAFSLTGSSCTAAEGPPPAPRPPVLLSVGHRKGYPRAAWSLPAGVSSVSIEVVTEMGTVVVASKLAGTATSWSSAKRVRPGTYDVRVLGRDAACEAASGEACTAWSNELELVIGRYAAYKVKLRSTHPEAVPSGRRKWTYFGDVVRASFRNLGNPAGDVQRYKVCHTKNWSRRCSRRSVVGANWDSWLVVMKRRWAGKIDGRYVGFVKFTWHVGGRRVAAKRIWIFE
jgi:N-acetylneuraminic acid mutarotase